MTFFESPNMRDFFEMTNNFTIFFASSRFSRVILVRRMRKWFYTYHYSVPQFMCNKELFPRDCWSLIQTCTNIYLPPFPRTPFDRTIQHIAVSSVGGWWLRTHVIWNGHCFAGAVCHLVDTGNVTCLYTNTARAHASGEFAIIPPAGADDDIFVRKDRTENCVAILIKPSSIACMQFAKLHDDISYKPYDKKNLYFLCKYNYIVSTRLGNE